MYASCITLRLRVFTVGGRHVAAQDAEAAARRALPEEQ